MHQPRSVRNGSQEDTASSQSSDTFPRIAFTATRPFLISTLLALAGRLGLVGRGFASRRWAVQDLESSSLFVRSGWNRDVWDD
jgi:hypothetical protein